MNKAELVEQIAKVAGISKGDASRALNATLDSIRDELKRGGAVQLVGFGNFAVNARAARTGRNPRTGESITIEAVKAPKFMPGKPLKDALN